MLPLVNALSDLLAAVLGRLGFAGRARRRDDIAKDLALLRDLVQTDGFGVESGAHADLRKRIEHDVSRHAEVAPRREIEWAGVAVAFALALIFALVTYVVAHNVSDWFALAPAVVTVFFFLLIIVGLAGVVPDDEEATEPSAADTEA